MKVPPEDLYFLQEVLKPALGVSYNAEAVREILERDMKSKRLSVLGYVQELLLRRYEALRDEPERPAPKGVQRRDQRPR